MLPTSPKPLRTILATGLAVALGLALGAATVSAPASADHAGAEPGPVHAGNTFGWYNGGGLVYDEKFHGKLASRWKVKGPGVVQNQHGMLTLNTARRGSVSATLERPGRDTGRWEARLRSRVFGSGHTNYTVMTELVPVRKSAERCGEQNIALNRYKPGSGKVDFYIRSRPDHMYEAQVNKATGPDQWHTFAVEVTKDRISWFVDAHVIATERRPAALSGANFKVRFTMRDKGHKRMNPARMQMDWLRYWSLAAPSKKSTAAPHPDHVHYKHACGPKA